ncbi:MAG TPA: type III pantothenate kinase [bacterium]|nr:type III pantothenate kinase [bacterium]
MDIVAIDIGNSRIKTGYFKNGRLRDVYTTDTKNAENLSFPTSWNIMRAGYVGISSVVPPVNRIVKEKASVFFKGSGIIIIKPEDCGISLKIRNPGTVGVDRVLNCVAALKLFGGNVVIVDIGTAVTVDILSLKREFIGGFILPGPRLWLESLKNTAMINESKISEAPIPGRDTGEAVFAGLKYGLAGAINGILDNVFKKYPSAKLVLTGGGSYQFLKHVRFKKKIREHLTLEGIYHVVSQNSRGDCTEC